MTCEGVRARLDDYLDGELPSAAAAEVAAHLGSCVSCRRELRALETLLERSRGLAPEIAPGRDLWPGIEARIAGGERATPRSREHRRWSPRWAWAAAAAVALAIGVPALLRETVPPTSPPRAAVEAARGMATESYLAHSEDGMLHAHNDLVETVERSRAVLPPEILKIMEENVRILDEAVGQIRSALEEDPYNRSLNSLLATRYQQETDLLKRFARI